MTQQSSTARPKSESVPGTGMRGGLGRTLLTAFLILSIVPLSFLSFITSSQARHNLEQELNEKLATIAALTESQIQSWVASQQLVLNLLCDSAQIESQFNVVPYADLAPLFSPPDSPLFSNRAPKRATLDESVAYLYRKIEAAYAPSSAFKALMLLDQGGRTLATFPEMSAGDAFPELLAPEGMLLETDHALTRAFGADLAQALSSALILTHPVGSSGLTLVALLDSQSLVQTVGASTLWTESGEMYLVSGSGQALKLTSALADTGTDIGSFVYLTATATALNGDAATTEGNRALKAARMGEPGVASYVNYQGISVIGAYRWIPELDMVLLVEQPRYSAFAAIDDLAAVLIGATMGAALLTALIAAAVTRRITLPIIELTATAVQIAAGDLDQKVPTTRHDEIGILARAFNVMTTKLRVLYAGLEQKVQERTQQLQAANAEVRYRAMQLSISAEVAQVITSILDREVLLSRVVELIRDCFQAYFVAIFFMDKDGQCAVLHKGSGGLGETLQSEGYRVALTQENLLGWAVHHLEPCMCADSTLDCKTDRAVFPHTRAELAVPLRIGQRRIGVLDVHSIHQDAFVGDEIMVLEALAGQVAVAIENARVYDLEHRAVEQLRKVEETRRRFLSNMSRELRVPLNNIIGFSRVIIKGIDGPITDLQRQDLNAIHDSGQRLLALINDILDIAQIEAGVMELAVQQIDLAEVTESVMPTANALLQGRPIDLRCDIASDLPLVEGDPFRLRQVLVKLLSNAAKFTEEGEIVLRVWPNGQQVLVSISDTGVGIPNEHRDEVFEMFQQVSKPGAETPGTGLGLTFSKEIIEMHGGSIQLESDEGKGTKFTIALPIKSVDQDRNRIES